MPPAPGWKAEARAAHGQAKPSTRRRRTAYAAKTGRRGKPRCRRTTGRTATGRRPARRAAEQPDRPDSALMRKSARHEYRQAYNAQAVVDAEAAS